MSIEKTLRAIPIKSDVQYKPNIYTQLGIYRNNKYKLRPTIYSSVKDSSDESNGYKIESVVDTNWSYCANDESKTNNNDLTVEDLQASLNQLQLVIGQVNQAIAKIDLKQEDTKGVEGENSKSKLDKKSKKNYIPIKDEKTMVNQAITKMDLKQEDTENVKGTDSKGKVDKKTKNNNIPIKDENIKTKDEEQSKNVTKKEDESNLSEEGIKEGNAKSNAMDVKPLLTLKKGDQELTKDKIKEKDVDGKAEGADDKKELECAVNITDGKKANESAVKEATDDKSVAEGIETEMVPAKAKDEDEGSHLVKGTEEKK